MLAVAVASDVLLMFPQVRGNPGAFRRSLMFSAWSYLGFETYQLLSPAAVVHAAAKGKPANHQEHLVIYVCRLWVNNLVIF